MTQQYGNWYEADIQKGKNRIRRKSQEGYYFKEKTSRKNKNKNREELCEVVGFNTIYTKKKKKKFDK